MGKNAVVEEMGGVGLMGRDMAYVAVIEGKGYGRERGGWYLGLAVRDESGYRQLKPGFGPYADQDDAEVAAEDLNVKLGHTPRSALEVVLSSMRGPGSVLKNRRL